MLRQALFDPSAAESGRYAVTRMREIYELAKLANNWFDELRRLSPQSMLQLISLGSKVQKLLLLKDRTVAALTRTDG